MDGSAAQMDTEQQNKTLPPYVSYVTFKTFIADIKEHGVPSRIDRSVLTRFNGSVTGQLIAALKFLQLVDASTKPTDRLIALVPTLGTPQWGSTLQAILRNAYPDVCAVDLANATPSLFAETFKVYGGADNVMRKCRTFFLTAAQDAGMPISPRILAGKKARTNGAPRPRAARRPSPAPSVPTPMPAPASPQPPSPFTGAITPPSSFQLLAMFDPGGMSPEEQAAVWLLIQYAKKKETAADKK